MLILAIIIFVLIGFVIGFGLAVILHEDGYLKVGKI